MPVKRTSLAFVLFALSTTLLLGGCNYPLFDLGQEGGIVFPKSAPATETALWGIIQTATGRANSVEFTATSSPTSTEDPFRDVCDWAQIVSEETTPQRELYPPNASVMVKWQLRNVGTCTWDEKYAVVFYSGEALGAPKRYSFTKKVAPGEFIDVLFEVTAPERDGLHSGSWKLRNPDGKVIGIGDNPNASLQVRLNVGGPSVTPKPSQSPTPTASLAPLLLDRCDAVQVMSILTIPEGQSMPPGARFNTMWRLRNIGGCTWSKQYALKFESGNSLNGASPVYLPKEVPPAGIVDVYVEMKSPNTAGEYTGYWKMMNDVNSTFGEGKDFNDPLVVSIKVIRSNTNTPLPKSATPVAKSITPAYTKTPVKSNTPVNTNTPGPSPTASKTPTITSTATVTSTPTETNTPTETATPTETSTPTATATGPTQTSTSTATRTATLTPTPTPTQAMIFNFAAAAPSAVWKNSAGTPFPYPGASPNGAVQVTSSVTLQDGITYNEQSMITYPDTTGSPASIEGSYTLPFAIQSDDRFMATVGCPNGMMGCTIWFAVECDSLSLWDYVDYSMTPLDVVYNLGGAAGSTTCKLILASYGSPVEQGIGVWVNPRIMR